MADLLTIQEAADRLKVKRQTVYRMIGAGVLPSVRISARIIRIREDDLNNFLEEVTEVGTHD